MVLYVTKRRATNTLAAALMIVVVVAAFSLLVAVAPFIRFPVPSTGGNAQGTEVVGSGRVVTKELQFSDFRIIHVESAFQVEIKHSTSYKVSVTMDDNLFDYLLITKQGHVLTVGLKPGHSYRQLSTSRAEIQLPDLDELQMEAAARGTIRGFSSSHRLVLLLSGASSTEIADTSVAEIETEISGASRLSGSMTTNDNARFTLSGASSVTLRGRAGNLNIVGSGASRLELSDFSVHDAKVNLSGASQATIKLDGRLDADLSGASTLLYIGEPTLGDINVTGGSTIGKK